mgnify:CR=1 FL=1
MTNKIKDILKTHKYLLLSFFLPVLLLEGIAIAEKIQPFGSESFLIVDALHQYLPFFADYQEKLKSMDSMFYSFHAGLGYNFLGLWAYYLASPLNLVIALVSKSMLTMILSHLYVLKIALCCFTAAFYFRKRRGKDEISIVAFGMAYGLCSYMVGYSWNIMWMEVMMMLPLILYGIDKLIKEHDGRLYCFALFISLWCNFYMSYMTCLFLILWYLLYSHKNVKEFFTNGFRFAGYSLLSGAMAAVVLLPAYLGIMQTSSAKLQFPKELWYGTFGNLFSRHFLGTTPLTMAVDDSKINLYCGILTLLMAGFYLAVREIRLIDKIRRLLLLVFLFFSFNMPVLGYVWHGFHDQYGIPNRFAFLYIFALLAMAYEGYCVLVRGKRKVSLWIYFAVILCGILIGITMKTSTVKLEMKTVYATVAAIAVYMICFALYQKKIFRKKIFTTLICFLFIVETAAMAVMGFQENGTVDTDSYFQDTKAITEVKKEYQKNVETRMELISGRMLDESIWHTLNGMTLFGSTAQGNVVDMMDQLGFYTGVNEYLYEGATPFTNNLMSMKYQIYRPYDTKYTEFSLKESVGNVTVYKNPYRTALAYTMDDLVQTWDYEDYNPLTDNKIERNYDVNNFRKEKIKNKIALQKELGLEENHKTMMIGIVSRLTDQKGFDLVAYVMDELCQDAVQIVALGTGEEQYENMFRHFAWKYPGKVSANIYYSEAMSHKIYASCDAFLMPSLFEPCGLSQLMSLRYGTVPIVRETGGLKDTVEPYNEYEKTGTGFSFMNYNAHEMLATVRYAEQIYYDKKRDWNKIVERAMNKDFSWKNSAKQYEELYEGM